MTVVKMGMEGHMPSRQLGTLEINNMSGRDRQYTTASAGQSQRAWIFTSIHLVALLASCFHKLTMAGSGALLHRANQQCFEGAQCKGFGRGGVERAAVVGQVGYYKLRGQLSASVSEVRVSKVCTYAI